MRDIDEIFRALQKSNFRRKFRLGRQDLTYLQNRGLDTVAQHAADFLLAQGVQWVALSVGADGMLLFHGEESVFVRAFELPVQTVVGVGDALLAGVIYALRRDLSIFDIARWGVAAGTAAAMTPGVGVGSFAEVSALFEKLGPHP